MKHENSNASTATSSSTAGTPPTPEINGNLNNLPSANINNNNNFNYHQMPPQHAMMNNEVPAPAASTAVQSIIPPHQGPQHSAWNQPPHMNYGNEMMDTTKTYGVPPPASTTPTTPMQQPNNSNMVSNNGEYVHYAVNEQYSNKFNLQAAPPAASHVSYDSWVSLQKKSRRLEVN